MTAGALDISEVDRLRAECDLLREENLWLRDAMGADLPPPQGVHLTQSEWRWLRILLARGFATRDALYLSIYGDQVDDGPEMRIIDVFAAKVRKKLRPFDIEIKTVWGAGYQLSKDNQLRLCALCGLPASCIPAPAGGNLVAMVASRMRPIVHDGGLERAAHARGLVVDDIGARLFEILNADTTLIDNILDDGVVTDGGVDLGSATGGATTPSAEGRS